MREFTDYERSQIDAMYKNGEKIDDIRSFLHCNDSLLRNYLAENGYVRRKRNTIKGCEKLKASRKHSLTENYFHDIDTEEKAYWLGFLYADGNVYFNKQKNGGEKGATVELTLKENDKYHLQNFLYCIGSDIKIQHKDVKLNGKVFGAERASIGSVEMAKDLIIHGCVPAKSLIIKPPSLKKDLISHFIRGYFDGDGCVAFYPNSNSYSYTIDGTKELLEYIVQEANLIHCTIHTTRSKCFELHIYSKKECENFHNYMYKNKNYFLERKYNKSLTMMKWCELSTGMNETQKMFDSLFDVSSLYYSEDEFDTLVCYQIF